MININNIFLQLGSQIIFDKASAIIYADQKIGIIGRNGSGKSTLLALLRGEIQADGGELTVPGHLNIASLSQEMPDSNLSAIDYVVQGDQVLVNIQQQLLEAESSNNHEQIAVLHTKLYDVNGYTAQARAGELLHGLGFAPATHFNSVNSFSGGWRMRINLARTLMSPADILMLDEPTNHLDLEAIFWLENYLKAYHRTLLIISHDREFLDGIVDHILFIEHKQFKTYTGNYTQFETLRAQQLALNQAMYEKQQKQIAHMMSFVNRFKAKATKAKQAQSRLKAIQKMELISLAQVDSPFQFEFKVPKECANPLIRLDKVDIGYSNKTILKNINLNIAPGDRIGLLGPNGAGKSTFIKLLAGEIEAQKGDVQLGKDVKVGYYAQHQLEQLLLNDSALQHMRLLAAHATEQQLRTFLGSFAFSGDKVFMPVELFSGGEKARLVLAMLVWQSPNLLLLDEPTNHLDMDMCNALTIALQNFEGAVVLVSHDRQLLRSTANELLLVADQSISSFDGTIEDYQKWIEAYYQRDTSKDIKKNQLIEPKVNQQEQRNKEKQIQVLEKKLDKLQHELLEIEQTLAEPAIYEEQKFGIVNELISKQQSLKQDITEVEQEWLRLHE